jgi:hypothetical protein
MLTLFRTTESVCGVPMRPSNVFLLLAILISFAPVWAARPPDSYEDDVSRAYEEAISDLQKGKDRKTIADRLAVVLVRKENAKSEFLPGAALFHADLVRSVKYSPAAVLHGEGLLFHTFQNGDWCAGRRSVRIVPKLARRFRNDSRHFGPRIVSETIGRSDLATTAATQPPEKRLAESRTVPAIFSFEENRIHIADKLQSMPEDPAHLLLAADRDVIEKLIPALRDRSPTRCVSDRFDFGRPVLGVPNQPRVCDLAMVIIEYHSKCVFQHPFEKHIHHLPDAQFEIRVRAVETWWKENRDRSLTEGIRAQLPKALTEYETERMAKNLILHAGSPTGPDAVHGRAVLLAEILRDPLRDRAIDYAYTLAEVGSPELALDPLYKAHKAVRITFERTERLHPLLSSFFIHHGNRREWEFVHSIVEREIEKGGVTPVECVTGDLLRSDHSKRMCMVPIWALALQSRYTDKSYRVSLAEHATKKLQAFTGRDFGYEAKGTAAEKSAAIDRAVTWWNDEGKSKYTFAFIEKELATKTPAAGTPEPKRP